MDGTGEGRAGGNPGPAGSARRFTAEEKRSYVEAYGRSGEKIRAFCAEHGLSTASLCKWRRKMREGGVAALGPRSNPRNAKGRTRGPYGAEERRQAVEALEKSGRTLKEFSRLWGVSTSTLAEWRSRYRLQGAKGLFGGRPGPRGSQAKLPPAVREEVKGALGLFPGFGLRRIRDFLRRFRGVKASVPVVRRVRAESWMKPDDAVVETTRRASSRALSARRSSGCQLALAPGHAEQRRGDSLPRTDGGDTDRGVSPAVYAGSGLGDAPLLVSVRWPYRPTVRDWHVGCMFAVEGVCRGHSNGVERRPP